jgi:hypothetical protein
MKHNTNISGAALTQLIHAPDAAAQPLVSFPVVDLLYFDYVNRLA